MIPLIDLQNSAIEAPDGALAQACTRWGFFYLIGHEIDHDQQHAVLALARNFFALPADQKNRIRRSASNSWGYFDSELTKNRPDWKEILDIGPHTTSGPLAGSFPQWPEDPAFVTGIGAFQSQLHRVAMTTMAAIVKTLDVQQAPRDAFIEHSSFIRLNYYPPCPDPASENDALMPKNGQLGINHHTDAGAVTVLLQDNQPGLQVYHDGRWETLTPPPGALVVNVGDIVQVWSNNLYRAPIHRVLADQQKARISIPYFLNPHYDYDYMPLNTDEPQYRAINWGEFRAKRSAGDYANLGAEVQISDYLLERV